MTENSNVVVTQQVRSAQLGTWLNPHSGWSVSLGQLPIYCKGPEDIEVLMYNTGLLNPDQPIEYNGFSIKSMLTRASNINDDIFYEEGVNAFMDLTAHAGIMSYPGEVFWIANPDWIKTFKNALIKLLPTAGLGFNNDDATEFANDIYQFAVDNPRTLKFWDALGNKFQGETYGKILMDFSAYSASRIRAKALSGLVPMIDPKHPSSVRTTYNINTANAIELISLQESKSPAPELYFFTLNLHSSLFKESNWDPVLEKTLKMTNSAMHEDMFDGLLVSVKGLDQISMNTGRIDVVMRMQERLKQICSNVSLPLWFSNFGIPGLSLLDEGVNYSSCMLNMNNADVYRSAGGFSDPDSYYGKVWHPNYQNRMAKRGVERWINSRGTMPDVQGFCINPTTHELTSAPKYRTRFSKPYNLASICKLSREWQENIENGEDRPGQEYLGRCDDVPFSAWGR